MAVDPNTPGGGSMMGFGSPWRSPSNLMDMEMSEVEEDHNQGLEEEYAAIMSRVLMDSTDAKDAVAAMEMMCQRRARQLRRESSQAVHKPARYMHLQMLAQEFEVQAATWYLIWCLYCNEQPLVGIGSSEVWDLPDRLLSRQILADKVLASPTLTRCAAVVAWLESLADDAMAKEGIATGLSQDEGVWLETAKRAGQGGLISEVDPDAPARQGAAVHPDNAAAEERLLQKCWQLARAGCFADARALCRDCGQPWRAASIGGPVGDWGPLPVGQAASRFEEEMRQASQAEELAGEVELGGPAAPRALWKWTCLQVALQAAANPTPGGKYEAALYGLLCGHLPSMLPVCTTWRDQCWAYCRTWLDQAADAALAEEHRKQAEGTVDVSLALDQQLVDVVCRIGGVSKGKPLVQGALTSSHGTLPVTQLLGQAGAGGVALQVPQTFEGVFAALRASGVSAVVSAASEAVHQVQQLLIQDDMSSLSEHLHTWLAASCTGPAAFGEASGDEVEGGLPPRATRMAAFGAHLLLALEALGVLLPGSRTRTRDMVAHRIHMMSEQVIGWYTACLMDRGLYHLVPQYLCHISEVPRVRLSQEALAGITQLLVATQPDVARQADQQAQQAYSCMDHWFSLCVGRQGVREQLMALGAANAPAPRSQLNTSIRPHESRYLLGTFVEGVRVKTLTTSSSAAHADGDDGPLPAESPLAVTPAYSIMSEEQQGGGQLLAPASITSSAIGADPYSRVTAVRWLYLPFLHASANNLLDQGQANMEDVQTLWLDPLEMTVALASELSLGDGSCAAAALHLLTHIVPEGFSRAAEDQISGLHHQVSDLQAKAAALQASGPQAYLADEVAEQAGLLHQVAGQLASLLAQMNHWRTFFSLERQAAGWIKVFNALQGASAQQQQQVVSLGQEGQQLVYDMQAQLLTDQWMSGLSIPPSSADTLSIVMVVTCPRANQEADAREPYPLMKGAELAQTEQRVRGVLQDVLSRAARADGVQSVSQVSVQTAADPGRSGHVTVHLSCRRNDTQALSHLMAVVPGLVHGSLSEATPVLVVNLCGPRDVITSLCARCCQAKVSVVCARLRHCMAVLGGDGSDGAALPEVLATTPASCTALVPSLGQYLADQLTLGQLGELLQLEAETVIQVMANTQQSSKPAVAAGGSRP